MLYDFQENQISTVGEKIHVGFVTTEKRGILMQVTGAGGDYLTVEISNAGTIRVAFDLGFERQELYEESQDYTDGQFHDVRIWRTNGGRNLSIQVYHRLLFFAQPKNHVGRRNKRVLPDRLSKWRTLQASDKRSVRHFGTSGNSTRWLVEVARCFS